MPYSVIDHIKVEASKQVLGPGAVYYGGLLTGPGVGGATTYVYDGIDNTGTLIDYFNDLNIYADRNFYPHGIPLSSGLYVELGGDAITFTLFVLRTPRELG
jgi:hypothetical protein